MTLSLTNILLLTTCPQYRELERLRVEFPTVPIMALTATANEQVMNDVIGKLRIQKCVLLTQSFNRPNLFYDVRPKRHNSVLDDISAWIRTRHPGETGIIYCLSRAKCEEVAMGLRQKQYRARHYHAAMAVEDKASAQDAWQKGECEIMVATVSAFISNVSDVVNSDSFLCRSRSEWESIRLMVRPVLCYLMKEILLRNLPLSPFRYTLLPAHVPFWVSF